MTTHRRTSRRIAAAGVVAILALAGTACGGDDEADDPPANTEEGARTTSGDDNGSTDMEGHDGTVDSPASELRATLTAGLQEHVYLAGITVYAAVNTPDAMEAAAGALDENSVALSEAIGSVYGDEAGEAFLGLWRSHIDMFVDYTTAGATGDDAGADAAVADLEQYGQDFGAFLEGANPNLPADAVASELAVHAESLLAAIDATIAGDAQAFSLLREAAGHMPMTAAVLAGGIAAQFPDQFAA